MAVGFRTYDFESEEYAQACELRELILRVPLGLRLTAADVAGEAEQLHFGGFDPEGNLLACVIAVPQAGSTVKIRQMAVAASHQGRGIGRALMIELHTELHRRGFDRFVLNARVSAIGFYTKLGYSAFGNEFTEVGIPHFRMEMKLPAADA